MELLDVIILHLFLQTMDGFGKLGFPHCIGAVDGTHIPIIAPLKAFDAYINGTFFHSMLLQGTTDHRGRFIDVEVGWGGRNHDTQVFNNSFLCEAMDAGSFVTENSTVTVVVSMYLLL